MSTPVFVSDLCPPELDVRPRPPAFPGIKKGASYPVLEIIAKLATALEIEQAKLPAEADKRRGGNSRNCSPPAAP